MYFTNTKFNQEQKHRKRTNMYSRLLNTNAVDGLDQKVKTILAFANMKRCVSYDQHCFPLGSSVNPEIVSAAGTSFQVITFIENHVYDVRFYNTGVRINSFPL